MGDDDQSTLYNSSRSLPRIFDAGAELESMFRAEMAGDNKHRRPMSGFPPSCLPIVRLLAGNQCCVDCGYDQSNSLNYASIGYGTILCHHCAHRHMTLSKEDSNVKHLRDDVWNLRSTLSLFEGGNRRLLEFVKLRSTQQPPKKGSSESYSEEVMSFNSVYQSGAAYEYRENLVKKVDATFLRYVNTRKLEDAANLELMHSTDTSHRDPFQQILSLNTRSVGGSPGFGRNNPPQSYDSASIPRRGSNDSGAPSIDMIKQRIASRRRSINIQVIKQWHDKDNKA